MLNICQAMRLFVGDPVWTPFNRPHDHLPARYGSVVLAYIQLVDRMLENVLSLLQWEWDLSCRKEYLKAFVDKEAGDHAVDAAA